MTDDPLHDLEWAAEDDDDDLNAWTEELRDWAEDIVVQDVEVVSTLDAASLLRRFAKVELDLRERGEMMEARTDTGRELHSARAAMLIELRRRRMR